MTDESYSVKPGEVATYMRTQRALRHLRDSMAAVEAARRDRDVQIYVAANVGIPRTEIAAAVGLAKSRVDQIIREEKTRRELAELKSELEAARRGE